MKQMWDKKEIETLIDEHGGGGSGAKWGQITGTLSDQTDLKNALDAKAGLATANVFTQAQQFTNIKAANATMVNATVEGADEDNCIKLISEEGSAELPTIKIFTDSYSQGVDPTPVGTISANSSDYLEIVGDKDILFTNHKVGDSKSVYLSDLVSSTDLATVATTGSYDDLTDKPTIPDTTYLVSTNTAQEISGAKTFSADVVISRPRYQAQRTLYFGDSYYQNGYVNIKAYGDVYRDTYVDQFAMYTDSTSMTKNFVPDQTQSQFNYNLGGAAYGGSMKYWNNLYLSGNLSDGTNSISIANIASKSYVSGTNDGTNWTSLTIGSDTYGLGGGGSAPSNMMTTDTAQTITATKTFSVQTMIQAGDSSAIIGLGKNANYQNITLFGTASIANNPKLQIKFIDNSFNDLRTYEFNKNAIVPDTSNKADLGSSIYKFKNLYLAGNLSDGTNNATISDIAALIAYAKTQGWIQ